MPNRIIKESICTSEEIDSLSPLEEVFFYRLMVNCDDYGCMDARPRILISRLFPLKRISEAFVISTLDNFSALNLIQLYKVNGRPYLHMTSWEEHQQIRAHKHKYPFIDDENAKEITAEDIGYQMKSDDINRYQTWDVENGYQMISDDINGNQEISDEIICVPNPIQSESNPNPNPIIAQSDDELIHALDFLDSVGEGTKNEKHDVEKTSLKKQKPIDETPVVFQLLLNDGNYYDVHQSEIDELKDTYPNANIEQEFKKMIRWIKDNPTKRKTKRGIGSFISKWLDKAQNAYHPSQYYGEQKKQQVDTNTSFATPVELKFEEDE